jgi:hypothetical protein
VVICPKLVQPAPWQRFTVFPVTPTLSVAAVQERLICKLEAAVAVRLVGAVGGMVSAETITERTGVIEWLNEPLVPVTARLELPTAVPADVDTVIVVEPDVVTVAGLKDAAAPEGRPEAEKLTEPVKLGPGTTLTV